MELRQVIRVVSMIEASGRVVIYYTSLGYVPVLSKTDVNGDDVQASTLGGFNLSKFIYIMMKIYLI